MLANKKRPAESGIAPPRQVCKLRFGLFLYGKRIFVLNSHFI